MGGVCTHAWFVFSEQFVAAVRAAKESRAALFGLGCSFSTRGSTGECKGFPRALLPWAAVFEGPRGCSLPSPLQSHTSLQAPTSATGWFPVRLNNGMRIIFCSPDRREREVPACSHSVRGFSHQHAAKGRPVPDPKRAGRFLILGSAYRLKGRSSLPSDASRAGIPRRSETPSKLLESRGARSLRACWKEGNDHLPVEGRSRD